MRLPQQFQVAGDGVRLVVDKFPLGAGKGHLWKLFRIEQIGVLKVIVKLLVAAVDAGNGNDDHHSTGLVFVVHADLSGQIIKTAVVGTGAEVTNGKACVGVVRV